ncbi:sesquiterpene cyclase (chloroplast) [Artemisia annua]|uniref:Sesquiterpene cyclase n=1 Tax=Artemisia annua TaxID=35608 RepID=A0A2U1PB45_ARTAN|nr:sesquiterpene cyclase [Artemisia annua]
MSTFLVCNASFSSSHGLRSSHVPKSSINQEIVRNTVKFPPSIWGDQFLTYHEPKKDIVIEKQHVEEVEEMRKKLLNTAFSEPKQHTKLIQLIDAVQRLGVSYHFEQEIDEALQHVYATHGDQWIGKDNLKSTSQWFRILRQQGFNVSSGIFKNHMDDKGKFKEHLSGDVQGMLGLYEAAYLSMKGEKELDDALEFTKTHLGNIAKDPTQNASLRTEIEHALNQPLRKRLPRLEALHYIPKYQQEASRDETLLHLAKLDYNILQSMHKREISEICKWWKNLDISNKLPHVRDRLVEIYFWILGVYFEPQHSRSRMFLAKTSMWLIVLDDTYDNYGTYEELEIFTEAVQRWSLSCLDSLPGYMKLVYHELINHYQEMEESVEKEGKSYQLFYAKEMVKENCRNLLVEAKWLKQGYVPTLEEHMSVSCITCAYAVMIANSYVGRETMVTEESFKWVAKFPPLVNATCLILRLMDDIAGHEEEQERDHVVSSIECYRNETGASKDDAIKFLSKQVEDAWKVINKECLRPTEIPMSLTIPPLNLARVSDILYKTNNGYNHAGEEVISYIKSLLVHPLV